MKKLGRLTLKELGNNFPPIPKTVLEQIRGGAVTVVFDRSDSMIYIYGNGNLISSYPAANNVYCGFNWPTGTYRMRDQNNPINGDSYSGGMGQMGGWAANEFYDPYEDAYRNLMAIHAGRYDDYTYFTDGCIRTTSEGVSGIIEAITSYGNFTSITVVD